MSLLLFGLHVFVVLANIPVNYGQEQEYRVVKTAQGPVRGYKDPSGSFIFYGIPYASAPTGRNKFKAPLPPPTWQATLEAVDRQITCPQVNIIGTNSEDCLITNVFTPGTNETNLPVYVIIHGGGYDYGFGNFKTPKALVENKNIIAVTFNYRLGPHGFLCLGTENIPGNAGIKDMLAALRWVKRNIEYFGGNGDNITLGGFSAGASAADLIMISKHADGLFNKVILESGSSVADWSAHQDPMETAIRHATSLNFTDTTDLNALEDFYLTTHLSVLMSNNTNFYPCVEHDYGEETFMNEAPVDIIKANNYRKVPVLYSFCDSEGLYQVNSFPKESVVMNTDGFAKFYSLDLDFKTKEIEENVTRKVRDIYFGGQPVGLDTLKGYINFYSDIYFIHPILRAVRMHIEAGHSQVYLYEYTFPTEHVVLGNETIIGAEHVAQSMAVYDEDQRNISEDYRKMKAAKRDIVYNFITTGEPAPSSFRAIWPPVRATDRTPLMNLNVNPYLQNDLGNYIDRIQLWDEIYEKYYKTPVAPLFSSAFSVTWKTIYKVFSGMAMLSTVLSH